MRHWSVLLLLLLAQVLHAATAPTVTAMTPADGTIGVDCFSTITVSFSGAMDPASTQAAMTVTPAAGSPIGGSWTWLSASQLSFRPSAPLADLTSYTVAVSTTALNASAVALATAATATFSTTTLLASGTPLPAGLVTSIVHLGAATEHIAGSSQSLIWDHFINAGYPPEQSQQPTPGVSLAMTYHATPMPRTWQVLSSITGVWDSDADGTCDDYFGIYVIAPSSRSAQVAGSTAGTYNCWLDGTAEVATNLSGTSPAFTLPAGLHLLFFKTLGTGGGGFSFAVTDTTGVPFADLRQIFSNGIAPQVAVSYPGTGASGWLASDDLLVQFSEPMITSSPALAATVAAVGGGIPSGTWSWPSANLLCFRPSAPLAPATTYTITLDPSGCQDDAGNTLAGPTSISFSTAAGAPPVPTGLTPGSAPVGAPASCALAATSLGTHLIYPVGAVPFQGHRYFYNLTPLVYNAAEAQAEATGGHLATISSEPEDNLCWQLGGRWDNWIGFTDIADGSTWLWSDGEPVTYINWAPGQPINDYYGTIQNYGHYFWGLQWDGDSDGPRTFVQECDVPYGPQVELVASGRPTIAATATDVTAAGAACTFDLTSAYPGTYSCLILNPDGTSATLPNAFVVTRAAGPSVIAAAADDSVRLSWSGSSATWVVVRRATASSATQPSDGTALIVNATLGAGTVVGIVTGDSFVDTALPSATAFAYDVYGCSASDLYTAPGTVTATTLAMVQPTLTSISPSASQPVAAVQIQLTGTGFDGGTLPPPPNSVLVGTHAYQIIASAQTRAQAQAQAILLGGTLPIIDSAAVNAEVLQAINGVDSWIGMYDPTATGNFVNADGSPLSYTNWNPGEPNNIGIETAVEMYGGSGTWNNITPSDTLPAVVQFPAGPLPSVLLTMAGQPSIAATLSAVTTTNLSMSVDLTGAAHGMWSVVLTNPDGGTATLANALMVDQPPVAGPPGCLTLHGTQDLAESASTTALDVLGPCTLECWFRSRAAGPSSFACLQESGSPLMALGVSSSQLSNVGSYETQVASPGPAIADGAWHHAALVSTGTELLLYQDGVLETTSSLSISSFPSSMNMLLGSSAWPGTAACDLADVRFWNAALPAGVIADWRGALASPAHPFWSSLAVEYQLNQASGTAAVDSISGLNAGFTGTPSWSPGMAFVTGTEETTLTGACSGSDPDGDPITFSVGTAPSHGQLTIDPASGAYTYIPDPAWYGTDAFTYTVSDGTFASPPTQVSVYLTRTFGHPVVAEPGLLTVLPGVAQIGTLNCANSDDLPVTFAVAAQPGQGTVTLLDPSLGVFLYTPTAGASGTDSFTFTVASGAAISAAATERISIAQAGYPIAVIDLGPSLTNASSIDATIIFSEQVNGLSATSFAVANGQISNLVSTTGTPSSSYHFVLVPDSAGVVTVMLPEGAVADQHGLPNLATVASVLIDWTAPVVTLVPATTSPVAGVPMTVTAEFSEPVTALTAAAVGVVDATVTGVVADGQLAQITLTPVAAGTMTVMLPAGVVTDQAGNANGAATIIVTVSAAQDTVTDGSSGTGSSASSGSGSGSGQGTGDTQSSDAADTSGGGRCGLGGGLSILLLGFCRSLWQRAWTSRRRQDGAAAR